MCCCNWGLFQCLCPSDDRRCTSVNLNSRETMWDWTAFHSTGRCKRTIKRGSAAKPGLGCRPDASFLICTGADMTAERAGRIMRGCGILGRSASPRFCPACKCNAGFHPGLLVATNRIAKRWSARLTVHFRPLKAALCAYQAERPGLQWILVRSLFTSGLMAC